MDSEILFFICGLLIGNGIRIMYYLWTGNDIPLLKQEENQEGR